MRTYVVQPGDSPAKIAALYAGCPKCARDLIPANPGKKVRTLPNGFVTFEKLNVNEEIQLPEKWFTKEFDDLPPKYFAALPHADGVTPSKLGVGAAGVLGDYASLDSAAARIAELPRLLDNEYSAAATAAAGLLDRSVSEIFAGSNPAALGYAQDAQAGAFWARGRALELAAALEAGNYDAVPGARTQIQDVFRTALDSARLALRTFHGDTPPPVVTPVTPPPPIPTQGAIPVAVQALVSKDPCAATSAAAVCAAQTVLGLSPDGKYGSETASKARAVAPNAPPACTPRPSWWAPAGSKNCPGGGSSPSPLPVPFPDVSPPLSTAPQKKGLGTAAVLGIGLLGAGAVGGAIYLAMNPEVVSDLAPPSRRPTKRFDYSRPTKRY